MDTQSWREEITDFNFNAMEVLQVYVLIQGYMWFGEQLNPILYYSELILGLRPANKKHRYKVPPSIIDWAQT